MTMIRFSFCMISCQLYTNIIWWSPCLLFCFHSAVDGLPLTSSYTASCLIHKLLTWKTQRAVSMVTKCIGLSFLRLVWREVWVNFERAQEKRDECIALGKLPRPFPNRLSSCVLALVTMLNSYSASRDNWCTETLWNRVITAQCEGMGEVGSARYEPALLPPCPSIRALCYSNCQRSTQSH